MGRYASQTEVPIERSRAEIEECLRRYGATSFTSGWDEKSALIAFRLKSLAIRFILPIPTGTEERFRWKTDRYGMKKKLTENQQIKAHDQELRQRWRALLLVVKAKLEAVECGISSLEKEFMAFIVMPNDESLGDWFVRTHLEAIRGGKMPLALEGRREEIQDAEIIPNGVTK